VDLLSVVGWLIIGGSFICRVMFSYDAGSVGASACISTSGMVIG